MGLHSYLGSLLLVSLVFVTGDHDPSMARSGYSAMMETQTFHSSSATKVFKHRIAPPWKGAQLHVTMHVDDGGAILRVIDNSGTKRLEKVFDRGDAAIDQNFDGQGVWRVELELKKASGRFAIKLTGV